MNRISKLLPALALLLGATLAMAMNFPGNPTERYAKDPSAEIWYDLTGITPGGSTYHCDVISGTCSREEPMTGADQVENGTFVKNGNLPVVNP
ncbi:hypothetical protein [Algoriphagus terrigena]|uniref:hypothetical protein n=1 Tax=Algoriphagus terrigena TaxID=344884 RepID=UPI00040E3044|nr:hypothetical protein [Algoriphagus terrigena]